MKNYNKEAFLKNTQKNRFEPYSELSELINRAFLSGYPADSLISTLVFTTYELARTTDNTELLEENYG